MGHPSAVWGLVLMTVQIKKLGLEGEMLITSKDSVAAQNRFVYYPDHLVRMPGPGQSAMDIISTFWTEPIFSGIFSSMAWEYSRPPRPADLADESVASFLTRRLGSSEIADNVVSAVLHGIYAGDIYQLSIKSLMPSVWFQEGVFGSLAAGAWKNFRTNTYAMQHRDALLAQELTTLPSHEKVTVPGLNLASVYSFKKGIGQLAEGLETALRANKNVTIKLNSKVSNITYRTDVEQVSVCVIAYHLPTACCH